MKKTPVHKKQKAKKVLSPTHVTQEKKIARAIPTKRTAFEEVSHQHISENGKFKGLLDEEFEDVLRMAMKRAQESDIPGKIYLSTEAEPQPFFSGLGTILMSVTTLLVASTFASAWVTTEQMRHEKPRSLK